MATYTEQLRFRKPSIGDIFNVDADWSNNLEKYDTLSKAALLNSERAYYEFGAGDKTITLGAPQEAFALLPWSSKFRVSLPFRSQASSLCNGVKVSMETTTGFVPDAMMTLIAHTGQTSTANALEVENTAVPSTNTLRYSPWLLYVSILPVARPTSDVKIRLFVEPLGDPGDTVILGGSRSVEAIGELNSE
jgi:hypothetical protein